MKDLQHALPTHESPGNEPKKSIHMMLASYVFRAFGGHLRSTLYMNYVSCHDR